MAKVSYDAIAKVIAELPGAFDVNWWWSDNITYREAVAFDFVQKFKENPAFKPRRFYLACGIDDERKLERLCHPSAEFSMGVLFPTHEDLGHLPVYEE